MFSDKRNVLQLVALLKAHGVTRVVLCPGSRNIPLVKTMADHSEFTCYSITDERSAGFFALGLSLQSDEPTVVCCTSGTALLNLHPAVAEAFYQQLPLIVISADRPAAWIGQMDGQTLPQSGVFGGLVKKSVALPEIQTEEEEWFCNRLINEALLETVHGSRGPVHINIPISEPLFQFTVDKLPQVRVIKRHQTLKCCEEMDELREQFQIFTKRLVIIGQQSPTAMSETDGLLAISKHFVCLTEHLGNLSVGEPFIRNFDVALATIPDEEMAKLSPELLITWGGHIVSKRLKKYLRQHPPKAHWHLSANGEVVDLYGSLTRVIEADPLPFLQALGEQTLCEASDDYLHQWKERCEGIDEPKFGYSQMATIGQLIQKMPQSSVLHLANSSSVRYAQLYRLPIGVTACCNRGTSGIEGSLSTAVGYAAASDQPNFLVIGDLSFFYDMNGLWNAHVGTNLRILLLNNGGGEIFNALPGLSMSSDSQRFVTADHQTTAKGWAQECGFVYLKANNQTELDELMTQFVASESLQAPLLLEVFTEKDEDVRLLKSYYNELRTK